jgi:D-tyrosyl-tRNA(Tyr) deacylase
MRAVVQRVKKASVHVDGKSVGQIGPGLLVLFGVHHNDTLDQTTWLAQKITDLRIFSDAQGKMNLSLQDIQGEILIVSQFTLYANCHEGRRPSYSDAAPPDKAKTIYEKFVAEFKDAQTGVFGAYMDVALVNDGPVTLIIDAK